MESIFRLSQLPSNTLAVLVTLRQKPIDSTPYFESTRAHSSSCAARLGEPFVQRIALPAIGFDIAILHDYLQRVTKTLSPQ